MNSSTYIHQSIIPKTFAVIVNWNLAKETITCVYSLKQAGLPEEQLIIVDNGSTDDSREVLSRLFRRAVFLFSGRNLGFARGNNQGIQIALRLGAEWIFLINNDTIVSADIFQEFSAAIQKHKNFMVWTPLIFYYTPPHLVWSAGSRLILGTLLTRPLVRGQMSLLPQVAEIDFATGCGLLVHRTVFLNVGLFDESLFMYGEDVDFCWRAQQRGFRIACATRAHMWHKVSLSSQSLRIQAQYWRVRHQNLFYSRATQSTRQRLMMVPLSFGLVVKAMLHYILNQDYDLAIATLKAWAEIWLLNTARRKVCSP